MKCCSPCFAPCLTCLTDLVTYIAKLPYDFINWLCETDRDEIDDEAVAVTVTESTKETTNYGGTIETTETTITTESSETVVSTTTVEGN